MSLHLVIVFGSVAVALIVTAGLLQLRQENYLRIVLENNENNQ